MEILGKETNILVSKEGV